MSKLTSGIVAALMVSGSVIYLAFTKGNRLHKFKQEANIDSQYKPVKMERITWSQSCKDIASDHIADISREPPKQKKKVRFCESVVEPKGDNREFRRQHRHKAAKGSNHDPEAFAMSTLVQSSDRSPTDQETSLGNASSLQQDDPQICVEIDGMEPDLQPRSKKMEALFGAKLPANRIALYCNRYHDRVLKALY